MDKVPGTSQDMLARQAMPQFDIVELVQMFNYDIAYEPTQGIITIAVTTPVSKRRMHLPFDRISFANFAKAIVACQERIANVEANGNEPI